MADKDTNDNKINNWFINWFIHYCNKAENTVKPAVSGILLRPDAGQNPLISLFYIF
jgi:hypothetical protein